MSIEKSANFEQFFERDPSVDRILGAIPHRAIYAKMANEALADGRISTGTQVVEGIHAFWGEEDVNVDFQLDEHSLSFSFSRAITGYFSLSWSLNSAEIEKLQSNQILSLHVDEILNSSGNVVRADIASRLIYVKGKDQREIGLDISNIQNRIVSAASMNDDSIDFPHAYRLWIDLIVTNARSRTLLFKNPMIVIQEQILL